MKISLRFLTFAATAIAATSLQAKPVPDNLGNGLDRLVESNLAIQQADASGKRIATYTAADGQRYTSEEVAGVAAASLSDADGRVLVRVTLDGSVAADDLRNSLSQTVDSINVTAVDPQYRGVGAMNAYVDINDVPALAQTAGVRAVVLEWRPRHNGTPAMTTVPVAGRGDGIKALPAPDAAPGQTYNILGTYMDQGVIQHRVDFLNKFYNPAATSDFEGNGLSIACISNSFAANSAHPASLDVTNNDLPGNAANPVNTTPVFVLQDDLSSATSDDEGRGMCQIVYKMAPKAKVGFGTADLGEVSFANTIRALAGINSADFPNASTQGFKADVVCDDVGYFDEPFYGDGIIGNGVDDVAAAGVHYFSSAANDVGINGYESVIRVVPNGSGLTAATNSALVNTNINLTGVPTNLYAGGFHNFNPTPGQTDVAQTVNVAANNTVPTILEWNDPYDQNTAATGVTVLYSTSATYTTSDLTFTVTTPVTQGTLYEVDEKATAGSSFDGIVTVFKSDGTTVIAGPQDTGTDETVRFAAPANDSGFVIKIGHFSTTTGGFTLTVESFTGFSTPGISSDWNLLAFRTDTGAYVPASSLTTNNLTTNQPVELGYVNRTSAAVTSIQYVLARSNMPSGGNVADHIRYLLPGNGRGGYGPAEYFTYNTVTTGGHAMAKGCNGTAAYSAFRPSIPEGFTSPGVPVIYFDKNQNRLATPEVRLQPSTAAMDAGNISANEGLAGLGSDSGSDFDVAANFSGTSAAAPHAAACALLILQAHGGIGSVTPTQMMTILHNTAFPHDLDPNSSSATARATNGGKVTLAFTSDNEANAGTGSNDPNSLSVSYVGPSSIASIVFNPQGDAAHGGCVTCGNNGLDTSNSYFSNVYPGVIWSTGTKAFTVGNGSVGLAQSDVTATFSNPPAAGTAPSTTLPFTMTLTFANTNFTGGKILRFTVGRGILHGSSVSGTVPGAGPTGGTSPVNASADLFGGGVLLPEGTVTTDGMSFSGTLQDGSTFTGVIRNRIGAGYSNLDGFGFINAQAAAFAPLP